MPTKSPYTKIAENVARDPLTAPWKHHDFSKALIEYLKLVYTLEEALLVQHLEIPPRFRTAGHVADMSGKEVDQVENVFASVHTKGGIIHVKGKYALPAIGLLINLYHVYPEIRKRTHWNYPDALLQADFVPRADDHCIFCGVCVDICPVGAMSLDTKNKRAATDPEKCMGCGACTLGCPENALQLIQYEC